MTLPVSLSALGLDERILLTRDTLGPQEQRAADTLLAHLDELVLYRAGELAELAGVSKATMSRLVRSLDYADFDELREQLRRLRTRTVSGQPGRAETPPSLTRQVQAEARAVERAFSQPGVGPAVDLLQTAEHVVVLGGRNSYPVALHLREQLVQCRPRVTVAPQPGQSVGEELVGLGPRDLVVAVGFRRRPQWFAAAVAAAREARVPVLLMVDPTGRDLAEHASVVLTAEIESQRAFDSYAAPMALVSLLADRLHERLGPEASGRTAAITQRYDHLTELE